MLAEPSALLFQTDLILPPVDQFKIGKDRIRDLYNKMLKPGGYPYENIQLQSERSLTTRRASGMSLCRFEDYSVRIEEKQQTYPVDEYVGIVKTVLDGLDRLYPIIQHRCRIQCVAQAHGSINTVQLLAGKVARVLDRINPFERPPAYFGVRFRFPPATEDAELADGEESTEEEEVEPVEHRGFVSLRFETYEKDIKKVWMEVAATHLFPDFLTLPDDFETIAENIRDAYRFLTEKSKRFLDQFDSSETGNGGE